MLFFSLRQFDPLSAGRRRFIYLGGGVAIHENHIPTQAATKAEPTDLLPTG